MTELEYFNQIKNVIENYEVSNKVRVMQDNHDRLKTNWQVGKLLVDAQCGMSRAKYGDNLIKKWAFKLSKVYSSNYSFTNLKYMRQFYRLFSIGHTVCDQLSWSHYRCLLPIKNSNECNYYINQVILNHLSVFILTFIRKTVRQILTFHFWNIEIICYLVYNYFRLV